MEALRHVARGNPGRSHPERCEGDFSNEKSGIKKEESEMSQLLLSLCFLMLLTGCHTHPPKAEKEHASSGHVHKAMRGGLLVELGEEFAHVELLHEPDQGRVRVFVLDGCAENPVRVPEKSIRLTLPDGRKIKLAAVENVLTGETPGNSSEFQGVDERLKGKVHWGEVTLNSLTVKGKSFSGVALKSHDKEEHHHDHHESEKGHAGHH